MVLGSEPDSDEYIVTITRASTSTMAMMMPPLTQRSTVKKSTPTL